MSVIPALARRIETWPTDRLQPYAKNARTHSPEQVAQIAASIAFLALDATFSTGTVLYADGGYTAR